MDENLNALYPKKYFLVSEAEFESLLAKWIGSIEELSPPVWIEPSLSDYEKVFQEIQREILSGRLEKCVPVVFAKAAIHFDLRRRAFTLKKLQLSPSRLFVYGMWSERDGMLGASPETLINIFSKRLSSMALAGTQIKGAEDCKLLSDPKERHEHRLVVDDMMSVLQKYAEVTAGDTSIHELPSLWHLKTEIQGHLRGQVSAEEIIKSLHPTSALGVYPREFGFQKMRDLPASDIRKKYGAPFAFIFQNGDVISVVAIRNIQWSNDQLILGSGAGLVRSSILENEWLELLGKRQSVRSLMGL